MEGHGEVVWEEIPPAPHKHTQTHVGSCMTVLGMAESESCGMLLKNLYFLDKNLHFFGSNTMDLNVSKALQFPPKTVLWKRWSCFL